jgi:hypothetical protein
MRGVHINLGKRVGIRTGARQAGPGRRGRLCAGPRPKPLGGKWMPAAGRGQLNSEAAQPAANACADPLQRLNLQY